MKIFVFSFIFLVFRFSAEPDVNNTKIILGNPLIRINNSDKPALFDYSKVDSSEISHFYDIKIIYNRIKPLKQFFLDKLNKYQLKMKNNYEENDIFRNFDELSTVYKYQVSCFICKKTFKTSQYLWIHTTRTHLFEKCENEKDYLFWPILLPEFLDWESIKSYGNKNDLDISPETHLKFKKCLLFSQKFIDFGSDFQKIYDFCLNIYYEKDSKGKIQDFFTATYNFFFKLLLVLFLVACLIYYSFAYYIYVEAKENP